MVVAYPPFFPSQILDGAGQPVANGRVLAYFAGSDVPAPLFTPDGTALGSSVTLNSSGEAVFCLRAGTAYRLTCLDAQGATVWTRENVKVTTADSGMANPMEAEGDIIVGGPDGQPDRLAAGTTGQVLKIGADGNPGWAADAEGMQNPMASFGEMIAGGLAGAPNVLSAPTGEQYLGVTSTVYGPYPQWWPLVNAIVKGLATTPAGTASGFTKGDLLLGGDAIAGGALHNYTGVDRLPIGTSGKILTSNGTTATWADPAAQEGDHKAKTSATDDHPGYLQSKVLAGDLIKVEKEQMPDGDGGYTENLRLNLDARGVTAGYVPTADGSNGAAWAAPATQPGDHHVVVTNADASAGTLADKLVAGSNVTITPVTDGDGVQTLRISAVAAGGIKCTDTIPYCCIEGAFSLNANMVYALAFIPTQDVTINRIRLYGTFPAGQYRAAVYLNNNLYSYSATSTVLSGASNTVIMNVPDTTIPLNGGCWLAFCGTAATSIRGKSGGLNGFSRKSAMPLWTWPATPSDYQTNLTDVAYYQIWHED